MHFNGYADGLSPYVVFESVIDHGDAPIDYVQRLRVEEVKRRLERTQAPADEIRRLKSKAWNAYLISNPNLDPWTGE